MLGLSEVKGHGRVEGKGVVTGPSRGPPWPDKHNKQIVTAGLRASAMQARRQGPLTRSFRS